VDTELLIEALYRRVDAFLQHEDEDAVLAPEAMAEARALETSTDPDSLAAVAWLYWCRYFARDPSTDNVSACLDRFLTVQPENPEALPDYLLATLDRLDGNGNGDEPDPSFLFSLGGAFFHRFGSSGERLDIDRAVAAMTACAEQLEEGEEIHGVVLCQLGAFLTRRAQLDGADSPDGAEAARVLTDSIAEARPGQLFRAPAMMNLVNLRLVQYQQRPGPEPADLLIEAASRTLHDLDPGDQVRAFTAELVIELIHDLGDHVRIEEPDRRIALYRLGVEAAEPGESTHVYALVQLGAALIFRGGNGTATADFDEAIALLRRAVTMAEGRMLAIAHTRLCMAHLGRFERLGDPQNVEDGIAAGRAALSPAQGDQLLTAHCATNLATALQMAHTCGVPDALTESIELLLTIVDIASIEARCRAQAMLGNAYLDLFTDTGDIIALDEALRWHRSTIDIVAPDSIGYASYLNNLAASLLQRSRRLGTDEDLNEAIELHTAAAARMPKRHPERLLNLANLVGVYLDRYYRHGDPDDAARALSIAREIATGEIPAGMASTQLTAIGNALLTAYEIGGSVTDLDDAVAVIRRATAATADRPCAPVLDQLGHTLLLRHEHTGTAADVVAAVIAHRQALAAAGVTEVLRSDYLANLCNALEHLYRITGDVEHLNEAVRAGIESAKATDGMPPPISSLTNLAKAYATRYQFRHDPVDLDHAIDAQRQVLTTVGPDNPRRVHYLSNLGGMLGNRYRATEHAQDLDEAIALLHECALRTTVGDTRHAMHLYNLGLVVLRRYRDDHNPTDLTEAVDALSAAAAAGASPVFHRIHAARMWAEAMAEHDIASSLAGYEQAVALLPMLAWHGLHPHDQERQLIDLVGVASDAAATALAAGRTERAVELLEQGRSVLWSQVLDLRTDLLALRSVRPDLAQRLDELRSGLEEPSAAEEFDSTSAARDRRMALARQWDETVGEVRRLPGFTDFLRPPPLSELLQAAICGPIVIVNVSRLRCDALIITTGGVDLVPLPDLTAQASANHADELAAAAHAASDLAGVVAHNTVLNDVLAWLWATIAEPVLTHVGTVPRLWWYPTGAMTRLPLHAAGIPGTLASVPDRTVSSYMPTIRALSLARNDKPAQGHDVLVVAVPEAAHAAPLDVEPEVTVLTKLSPGQCTIRRSTDAARERVLADLPRHNRVHFACHGVADADRPSASGLLLHDERLTVADVSRLRLGSRELAYLSACETAAGGNLPDESLHLGAALNLAGYRHVVATLWPIYDATAAEVARGFYERLGTSATPDRAAFALHEAVHQIRARGGDTLPTIWVPYVHIGL
jgi:tetratricopeptide (TPR) repeat protein